MNNFFLFQQQQQQQQQQVQYQQQQQQQQAQYLYFQQTQNTNPFQYPQIPISNPTSNTVHKPVFIRNRTRKNMRQKSVATAVKASHLLSVKSAAIVAGSGMPLIQNYQCTGQIPFYQAAAQIPTFQMQQVQQAAPVLLAKSPVTQSGPVPILKSSHPSSPSVSLPARSPNSNSSDYVKLKLQQKIRSRMVSKGQIPPNPTEEELRLCGIQIPNNPPQQYQQTHQQLPTPKQSPQQIPRAFNNNAAAFIAAPSTLLAFEPQCAPMQDDLMKYFDFSGFSQPVGHFE